MYHPEKLAEEREIFKAYNRFGHDILMEPVRAALYATGDASPDDIVEMATHDPKAIKRMMSFVFSWAFHEIIPKQYEKRHLDGVFTTLTYKPETLVKREADMDVLAQADVQFFSDCIHSFGGIITDYEESYLIDDEGMGPDLEVHLSQIMTRKAVRELERMNTLIPYIIKPDSAPDLSQIQP